MTGTTPPLTATRGSAPSRRNRRFTSHEPAQITESPLGERTEIRPHARLHESTLDDYTYRMERVRLDYTTVGKFGDVASDVRLGPTDHPIDRPTAHRVTHRAAAYGLGEDDDGVFEWRADQPAGPLRRRFPADVAARTEAAEWWYRDRETLSDRLEAVRDLEPFLSRDAPEEADASHGE